MKVFFCKLLFACSFWLVFYFTKIIIVLFKLGLIQKKTNKNTILYFENFPVENAGYQYRAAKWADVLRENGYNVEIWTLIKEKDEFDSKTKQEPFSKFLLFALVKRFKQVIASRKYETVIVRRELLWFNDYGNLFLDKLLLAIHPNAILDFDDDISAAKNQPKIITNWFGRFMIENGNKFNDSLRLYKRFIVASSYLRTRVHTENSRINEDNICVIPTCVDYDKFKPKIYPDKLERITFGWIGGDHNYPQLDTIISVLDELSSQFNFKLLVIGGKEYKPKVNFEIEFRPWSLDSEVNDLYDIDVGLMPLIYDREAEGKGGLKLLQYLGIGIASIANSITINNEIVNHGRNSFLVSNLKEWREVLYSILSSKHNLSEIGKHGRDSIMREYTFVANQIKYFHFISLCAG